jgi:hypothetical protein
VWFCRMELKRTKPKTRTKMGQAPKENRYPMKDIFWNIRGLGKRGRKQSLVDVIKNMMSTLLVFRKLKLGSFPIVTSLH